jgi:hypothetical protein
MRCPEFETMLIAFEELILLHPGTCYLLRDAVETGSEREAHRPPQQRHREITDEIKALGLGHLETHGIEEVKLKIISGPTIWGTTVLSECGRSAHLAFGSTSGK